MKAKVTIKDVAREAHVTAQTVSRAFRNKDISKETRDRILEIAKNINYVQNNAAIALRRGSGKNIAVMVDSLKNIYFAIMTDYLEEEIQKQGYTLLTMFKRTHIVTEDMYLSAVASGANGIISFLEPDENLGEVIRQHGVPLMVLGRRTEIPELDYLSTDDVQGGRLAAKRLISAGCKRFAYIAEGMGMTCVGDRLQGFNEVLTQNGMRNSAVFDCGGGAIAEWLQSLRDKGEMPDGIFCFNDVIAFVTLSALKKLGITATKVIGYDNLQAEFHFPVRLTTIGVDKRQYAEYAVRRLLEKINCNDGTPPHFTEKVPVELIEGETV